MTQDKAPDALAAEVKRLADDHGNARAAHAHMATAEVGYHAALILCIETNDALFAAIDRLAALAASSASPEQSAVAALRELVALEDLKTTARFHQARRADYERRKPLALAAARAALSAAPVSPQGWVMVPVEPTKEMRIAGASAPVELLAPAGAVECYRAMLAAAPVAAPVEAVQAVALLRRIRGWDHLDTAGDGPYWKREIDAALASQQGMRVVQDHPAGTGGNAHALSDEFFAEAKRAGVTHFTPEFFEAVRVRSEEIAAALAVQPQQPQQDQGAPASPSGSAACRPEPKVSALRAPIPGAEDGGA